MKLSRWTGVNFNAAGEMILDYHEVAIVLSPQEVARLRRILNARADLSGYLTRQRAKRAAKART